MKKNNYEPTLKNVCKRAEDMVMTDDIIVAGESNANNCENEKKQRRFDITPDALSSLQKAFTDFQVRAEQLSHAYASMQDDFRKVNVELDRKNNELAKSLAVQEETRTYLYSILESMENGVIGIDLNGSVTHYNKAASIITGYSSTEVLGRMITDVFKSNQDKEIALLHVIRTGQGARRDEKVLWHKDGHPVPVSFQTALLRDRDQRCLGAVEIFSDVSKIKALEEEMQQTRTMAVLGEMSATVAHEIRNPLGAMGMWAGLLERDLEGDDPRKMILGKITEGLSRLNKIVSNLLVYTRPVRAELRKVNLNCILDEIVSFVDIEIERLGKKIVITKQYSCQNSMVLADPEKLNQVVMNLCLNAIQAMPQGGTLSVAVINEGKDDSGYACFTIGDTGVGIAKDNISKI
ncbi:MAG TPA: PAS domain S-box protein, partial [Chitinispirillaceae bacterium]|nr:PAS domain S-box protein [Chitinispirillaceae bacterium]